MDVFFKPNMKKYKPVDRHKVVVGDRIFLNFYDRFIEGTVVTFKYDNIGRIGRIGLRVDPRIISHDSERARILRKTLESLGGEETSVPPLGYWTSVSSCYIPDIYTDDVDNWV